jgi:hypothetical protein
LLLQQPGKKRLCQILRIFDRKPATPHIRLERIPIRFAQFGDRCLHVLAFAITGSIYQTPMRRGEMPLVASKGRRRMIRRHSSILSWRHSCYDTAPWPGVRYSLYIQQKTSFTPRFRELIDCPERRLKAFLGPYRKGQSILGDGATARILPDHTATRTCNIRLTNSLLHAAITL